MKEVIKKYSAFVQFPISVNGERKVNTVDAMDAIEKRGHGRGIRGVL